MSTLQRSLLSFIAFPGTSMSTPLNAVLDDAMIKANLTAALSALARADMPTTCRCLWQPMKSPAGTAKGKAGLDAFRNAKGVHAWELGSATTIHMGLVNFGFIKEGSREEKQN
jgi:hypothetical protein